MRAALLYAPGDLRLVDLPMPTPGPNDLLVKVQVCAVCPTDIRKFRVGDHGVMQFPINLGHEWTGTVVDVGSNLRGIEPGIRIVGGGYAGYAEYALITPRHLEASGGRPLIIPEGVKSEDATFVEPLADCIHAVIDQAEVQIGQTVAIVGCGQMALQQLCVAKQAGARVIMGDILPDRLARAREWGADLVVDASQNDFAAAVRDATHGQGADAAILSVGSPQGMVQALDAVRARGHVVLFGGFDQGVTATIEPNTIHYKELTVRGSEWIGIHPYQNRRLYALALDLIARNAVPVGRLITHRVDLEQIHDAFEALLARKALKAVVEINHPGD